MNNRLLLCLIVLCGAEAEAKIGLELLEIDSRVSSRSFMEFFGRVENTSNELIDSPVIGLTFKKAGKIIAVADGFIGEVFGDPLPPGGIATFEVLVEVQPDDFDEFSHQFAGRSLGLDPVLVEGDLEIPEIAFNIIESSIGSEILGEAINRTNAIIGEIEITFQLFDAEGNFLGEEQFFSFQSPELYPGESFTFGELSEINVEQIASWEITWSYTALRFPGQDVATGTAATSWGRLKLQAAEGF